MGGANRVGGPGDPKGPKSQDEIKDPRLRKIEKVKQVDEAENEGRRKKFRKFMESNDTETSMVREPSPFETEFHKAEGKLGNGFRELSKPFDDLEDLEKQSLDDPEQSPPPPNVSRPRDEEVQSKNPLPQSPEFWHESSEQKSKSPKTHEETKAKEAKEIVCASQKEILLSEKKGKKNEEEKRETASIPIEEEKKGKGFPKDLTPEEEAKIRLKKTKKAKEKDRVLAPIREEELDVKKKGHQKEDAPKQGAHTPQVIDIEPPSTTTLPPNVVPIAQAATTQSAPYLNAEINPLFFQMVGAIHVMLGTPGVTRTEIELNSPSFSNSKFFGSKIMIEKYATAPDSLNIRLTGPDQAVKSFNQNISSLYAAFENGTFDFRIGRISAEYSTDRPVFKRRDREEKSSGGGGDFSGDKNK